MTQITPPSDIIAISTSFVFPPSVPPIAAAVALKRPLERKTATHGPPHGDSLSGLGQRLKRTYEPRKKLPTSKLIAFCKLYFSYKQFFLAGKSGWYGKTVAFCCTLFNFWCAHWSSPSPLSPSPQFQCTQATTQVHW